MKAFLLFLSLLPSLLPAVELSTLRDPEVVKAWSTLPVQDDGRVKPLYTVASFRLLRMHGTRTLRFVNPETQAKDKLNPVEWMLVTWFKPDLAKTLPLFRVDSPEAVVEIGADSLDKMEGVKGKYTFKDIEAHRERLMEKAQEYDAIESKQRSASQQMIVDLARNFVDFEIMLTHWDFVRLPFGEDLSQLPKELADTLPKPLSLSTGATPLVAYVKEHQDVDSAAPWLRTLLRNQFVWKANKPAALAIFPVEPGQPWSSTVEIMAKPLLGLTISPKDEEWMKRTESLYLAAEDPAAFKAQSLALGQAVRAADTDTEARHVDLEYSYLRTDYFYYALILFVSALLLLGLGLAVARASVKKFVHVLTWLLLASGTALALIGIVIRCIIMERPPITTLYETILFIATSGAILGLLTEWITRKRWGLLLCALSGVAGLYLAIRFEDMDKQDTMQQLQAVLMTNFWLATHVPCINLGYAACMVSNIIAMVYLPARAFRLLTKDSGRDLTRMSYGFLCAGLFLALIGTILGGIWANYSWGRFWGWDPKENGALMICIMCLIMLHARLGGYIKDLGIHVCSLILGSITLFSWFGVNQLGVGLHAYGFTEGVWGNLCKYWGVQILFGLLAVWVHFRSGWKEPASPEVSAAPAVEL
jgi:ABC-type transport system involved in cytochrome c biogenesis permease subunit